VATRIILFIYIFAMAALFVMAAPPAFSADDPHAGHGDGAAREKTGAAPQRKAAPANPGEAAYSLPVIEPASDFRLTDLDGKEVTLKDFGGRIKIITFIYTSCPDACLLATGTLSRLQGILRDESLLGEKVKIASISFDPERDTPERLREYAEGFGADGENWLFLRGTDAETKAALSGYDIWTKNLPDGRIDHVMRVYLVDGEDRIREIYNLGYLQPELVVNDINAVLREKVSLAGH